MENKYFECECYSPEHTLRISYDCSNQRDKFIAFYVQLSKLPFWRRLWAGIKYIFGYECRYGHWEEFLLDDDDVLKIKWILSQYSNK